LFFGRMDLICATYQTLMKKLLRYLIIFAAFSPFAAKAQFENFKDSVVQLYGVVMTADSLRGLPVVSVIEKRSGRGTLTNNQGVFSIVVLKGDEVEFSSIGFKTKTILIPRDLEGNQYSIVQLMVNDTVFLPATIIKPRPTREQFERDFVNTPVPDDNIEVARQNTDEAKRRALAAAMPRDGREATNFNLVQNAQKYYYAGQTPPQNIFNPVAWAEFIKAWKRGDFRKK
jgi:CarboxypepD_reg-like domain